MYERFAIIKTNELPAARVLQYAGSVLMAIEISKRLFDVRDYYRMAEAGILQEGDKVELIEGEVLAMSPIGSPHSAAIDRAARALMKLSGDAAIVRIQGPVRLDDYNEPQPDIALLRPKKDFYAAGHPSPPDILLIVEIAQSSLQFDQTIKLRLYGRAGVPEYWVSDIQHDRLFAYSDFEADSYRTIRELHRGDFIAPKLLPERQIPVDSLLP